jgi:uncharacterized cofD-like protein
VNSASVVALGGGHGLANSLQALRDITTSLTAIVGVADDGGSSGRLRAEFGSVPPGDLRMALAALCRSDTSVQAWDQLLQYRFPGDGTLAGHALGNLLLTAAWQQTGDIVAGLDDLRELTNAAGRVLPCSTVAVDIFARVQGAAGMQELQGQAQVARTSAHVVDVWVEPANAPACQQAMDAIGAADVIVLGPGSWYTSVLPHVLITDQRNALERASAKRILILNVNPTADRETAGLALPDHLKILQKFAPNLRWDVVIADPGSIEDEAELTARVEQLGAHLLIAEVVDPATPDRGSHDPKRLAAALRTAIGEA